MRSPSRKNIASPALALLATSLLLAGARCNRRPVGRSDAGPADAALPCGPETCAGCCTATGECAAGDSHQACGQHGQLCADCGLLGATCQAGACQGGQPCGPQTCDGCCDGPSRCLPGDATAACGQAGAACSACAGGATCQQGSCCLDQDGDGHGQGCPAGPDCDDHRPGVVTACTADGCPEGWAHIPAGEFLFGCDFDNDDRCDAEDNFPMHTEYLDDYCIQRTEVTVADYRACQDAGLCPDLIVPDSAFWVPKCTWTQDGSGDLPDHPINCVALESARTFCQSWLGGDLPTEYEWEKAARGTDGRSYPWGDDPYVGCDRCNTGQCLGPGRENWTWPVGYLADGAADSPYGLKDICGNIGEMTRSCGIWVSRAVAECDAPSEDIASRPILRGLSHAGITPYAPDDPKDGTGEFSVWSRSMLVYLPSGESDGGFRCIRYPATE